MKRIVLLISLIMVSSLLAACTGPTPEVVEKEVEKVVTKVVTEVVTEKVVETVIVEATPQVVEKVVTVTPEPTPEGPAVGGKLVWALSVEPPSLDPHGMAHGMTTKVLFYIGATLVAKDPTSSQIKYVPYLAESWDVSEDGLTWDFFLRKDVVFHDGTPLTAEDFAWTFNRGIDPEATGTGISTYLTALDSAEAVDDYTLRLNLKEPSFPLLYNLTRSVTMPMPKATAEEMGEQYGRQPIGVGPFQFKEWVTGEKIVLERNPDFNWGPPFAEGGSYVDTLEIRILPEYSTAIAGLETGEVDYYWDLQVKDVERIRGLTGYQILETVMPGADPSVFFDSSKPPFDDVRVRKAFALAVNRQVLVKVVALGEGLEQRGPVSASSAGYWPGIEEIGFHYDLAQAKALMAEAGYTAGGDGMLYKDGQPLKLTIKVTSSFERNVKSGEILQEQWRELGADVEIQMLESGALVKDLFAGDYDLIVLSPGGYDFDWLVRWVGSSEIGGWDFSKIDDPELSRLLMATRTTMDPDERQKACEAASKYIIDQAVFIPLFASDTFDVLNNRVQGALFDKNTRELWLNNAFITPE